MHVSNIEIALSVLRVDGLHQLHYEHFYSCDPYGDHKFEADLLRNYCAVWERSFFASREVTKDSLYLSSAYGARNFIAL